MKVGDIDFTKMLAFSPDTGRILLGTDRMLLFRQEAFATLHTLMAEQLGESLARGLLAQFGYRCGVGDYRALTRLYSWDSEQDEIAAGPVMHMWEGLVHVEVMKLAFDRKARSIHMMGHWRNSYEAENHVTEQGQSPRPVCYTLTGYAAGWATSFIGAPCIAIETMCAGKGDPFCAFEIRREHEWGPEADPWKRALASTDTSLSVELERKLREVERARATIAAIETPIIQVWSGVVVLPVIGAVDPRRSEQMTASLLRRVSEQNVRCVIVDLTGVESLDTSAADQLVKMAQSVRLLGSRCLITGVRPEVAQTLTSMGMGLEGLRTLRDLKQGLEESLRLMGYAVTRKAGSFEIDPEG